MKRRDFIQGTTVGTCALITGVPLSRAFGQAQTLGMLQGRPLCPEQIAYWHDRMIGVMEENGLFRRTPHMPSEPEWKLVEKGIFRWHATMPPENVLYNDLKHIDGEFEQCAYAFSEAEMSFGRVRADFFLKDVFNPAACAHLISGSFAIVTVNDRLLGYAGYMRYPKEYTLNFEGLPYKGKLLKAWAPIREHFGERNTPCHVWERA